MLRILGPLAFLLIAPVLSAQKPAKAPVKAKTPTKVAVAAPEKAPVAEPKAKAVQVGDPAPAFKVARWVKGTPVTALEKGKVYVVEFWATWCGPCRETIPHLTELAKQHQGKATFIGVDVWERGADAAAVDKKVDDFVKEMGDKMDYAVCRDGQDGHMAQAWMQAANQKGIPAAFIVDKEGRIAHIGHPMNEDFSKTLEQVVAGTHDLKAAVAAAEKAAAEEKAKEAKEKAQEAAWKEASPAIQDAVKAKDWAKVLTLADQAEANHPDLKAGLKRPRFLALAATDPTKAQALVDADLVKPDFMACMQTVELLLEKGLDKRWAEQALPLIDKAVALEPRIAPRVGPVRFGALLRTDPAKAKAFFEAEKAQGAAKAARLAASVLNEEGVDKATMESALGILEEALKAPTPNMMYHQAMAEGYAKLGRPKDAVKSMETFLAWAKKAGAPPAFLKENEDKLKVYQAAQ